MIELIYQSKASYGFDLGMVESLLGQARHSNKRQSVTGMLFFDGETFVQILEGETKIVEDLYASICEDSRHHNVQQIYKSEIRRRSFEDWSMGYEFISPMSGQRLQSDLIIGEEQLGKVGAEISRGVQFFRYLKRKTNNVKTETLD